VTNARADHRRLLDAGSLPCRQEDNMKSGYQPETGICWSFGNKGDNSFYDKSSYCHCQCPACTASHSFGEHRRTQYEAAFFGRCRSGRRWFWAASTIGGERTMHGWTDTEEEAMAAAMDALRGLKATPLMKAISVHGHASHKLKEINEARRRARPAPDTSDTNTVEYLYSYIGCWTDGWVCECDELTGAERIYYHTKKYPILRRTKQRIFYNKNPQYLRDTDYQRSDRGTGYVDRQKIEAAGEVWDRDLRETLYLSLEHLVRDFLRHEDDAPDLNKLKAEMAAAHPDHGGSNQAFIEARARYVQARRSARGRGMAA
jgi:hypothetical protein